MSQSGKVHFSVGGRRLRGNSCHADEFRRSWGSREPRTGKPPTGHCFFGLHPHRYCSRPIAGNPASGRARPLMIIGGSATTASGRSRGRLLLPRAFLPRRTGGGAPLHRRAAPPLRVPHPRLWQALQRPVGEDKGHSMTTASARLSVPPTKPPPTPQKAIPCYLRLEKSRWFINSLPSALNKAAPSRGTLWLMAWSPELTPRLRLVRLRGRGSEPDSPAGAGRGRYPPCRGLLLKAGKHAGHAHG